MIRIVISGICGRMGRLIGLLTARDTELEIVGALEAPGNPSIGKDIGLVLGIGKMGKSVKSDFSELARDCDILIEFTTPEATIEHLTLARRGKTAMVIGTTGFNSQQIEQIKKAGDEIPIVFSPNMSIGANLLFKTIEFVSTTLGGDYQTEIVEAHHSKKKDAPSGTAKRLSEIIAKIRGKMPPVHSIRAGDIVGEHMVLFAGNSERIELIHRAHSREAFAKGALNAAKFLAARKRGLYTMHDVIDAVR